MQRLIDLDAAIKDARSHYCGVHDAVLMEHFLNSQPVVAAKTKLDRSRWEECRHCQNGIFYGNKFCRYCGRPITEEAWTELERRIMRNESD